MARLVRRGEARVRLRRPLLRDGWAEDKADGVKAIAGAPRNDFPKNPEEAFEVFFGTCPLAAFFLRHTDPLLRE